MAQVISVSALNTYVRSLLESDAALADIAIEGEISNFSRNHKTGHCYFTLKDSKASVKAVMFRSEAERLAFMPENGMLVVVRGRITLYERDGAFQIYTEFMFPKGQGAAQMAFGQLKARLEAEGLMAPELKKRLPAWPKLVGLVTSKTGAALQDILNVARRRCPAARFVLAPVSVQGSGAAGGIIEAVIRLDADPEVDVILIARGGGSAEDLGVFNDEGIARAVFACGTPVASAIGHEVDYTILDFVADLRAPTPSAAAELILPDMREAFESMMNVYTNISNFMQFKTESWYNILSRYKGHPAIAGLPARLAEDAARLWERGERLGQLARGVQARAQARLGHSARLAASLNPYAVLARGYALAENEAGPVRSVRQVAAGEAVTVRLNDGTLGCRVEEITEGQVASQ